MPVFRCTVAVDVFADNVRDARNVMMEILSESRDVDDYGEPTDIERISGETCYSCGELYESDELVDVGGVLLCEDCRSECQRCGNIVNQDSTEWLNGEELCEDCYNEALNDEDEERMDYEKG